LNRHAQFTAQAVPSILDRPSFRFRPASEQAVETAELERIAVEAGRCDQLTAGQRQPFCFLFCSSFVGVFRIRIRMHAIFSRLVFTCREVGGEPCNYEAVFC
jgi:hypothetical protein